MTHRRTKTTFAEFLEKRLCANTRNYCQRPPTRGSSLGVVRPRPAQRRPGRDLIHKTRVRSARVNALTEEENMGNAVRQHRSPTTGKEPAKKRPNKWRIAAGSSSRRKSDDLHGTTRRRRRVRRSVPQLRPIAGEANSEILTTRPRKKTRRREGSISNRCLCHRQPPAKRPLKVY